jgi:predicted phosphoribosyltransferase
MRSRFYDRTEAGEYLAEKLVRFADRDDVVVLALPRGGVRVGFEVARRLRAPLDIVVVRKLGVPGHEELAMGAVASGGVCYLNHELIAQLRIPRADVDTEIAWETCAIARRERLFRGARRPLDLAGKTVILVDDGVATGSTLRAAVEAVRAARPARVVVASPTWSSSAHAQFELLADEVVGVMVNETFFSVGQWYEDFSVITDEEVRNLLERADLAVFSRSPGGPACGKPRSRSSSV